MQKLTMFQKLKLSFAPQILYRSEDGHIEITDSMENGRPVRLLTYDGIRESGIYLDERSDRDPLFYYMKTLKEISLKYDGLNRALLIGGGGMSFPGYFLNCVPDGQMTVVEKDQKMLELAKKYFFFEESDQIKAVVDDGAAFIANKAKELAACGVDSNYNKYDFIIFDAFDGNKASKSLLSEGTLKLAYQMTSDDGILAINMLNEKPGVVSMQTHLCQAILRQIYRNTSLIICPQKWNCIILASDRKL